MEEDIKKFQIEVAKYKKLEEAEKKEKKYICTECNSKLKSQKALTQHKKIHNKLCFLWKFFCKKKPFA